MERNQPLFGANIDPTATDAQEPFRRARLADENGLDLITIQDHVYNRHHLENWTLLSALAATTRRVHLGSNVLTTPLRPPAVLAKMAATLDVISGGRAELGIGAGAYEAGIKAFGGPTGSSGERYRAFKESLEIIRGLLASNGDSFTYEGEFYQVKGARFGPPPAHPMRIWTGAVGPSMLELTGRLADGLLISNIYIPVERLEWVNQRLDEGAAQAGRSPLDIRRGYDLMGVIELDETRYERKPGQLHGPVEHWVAEIVRLYYEHRQDTFIVWPIAGDEARQIEVFAREIVPEVKKNLNRA
jgi:alkanesulfonate monooxygenase SsuD/methylene tetrahydromethanopterin reductase-like flavin-dependent oxidoreductase (luciferase family)